MSTPSSQPSGVSHLHHFAIEVSDMEASLRFYRDLFGFKLTERHSAGEVEAIPVDLAFLRLGEHHHDLVLCHNPNKTYRARRPEDDQEGPPSFHHIALECEDRAHWLSLFESVRAAGIEIIRGPVLHSAHQAGGEGSWGENESFYILDPDGHRVEVFCDMAKVGEDGVFVTAAGERLEDAHADEV